MFRIRVSRATDDLVRLAVQALHEAKRRGRDRIVIDLPAGVIGSEPASGSQDLDDGAKQVPSSRA